MNIDETGEMADIAIAIWPPTTLISRKTVTPRTLPPAPREGPCDVAAVSPRSRLPDRRAPAAPTAGPGHSSSVITLTVRVDTALHRHLGQRAHQRLLRTLILGEPLGRTPPVAGSRHPQLELPDASH